MKSGHCGDNAREPGELRTDLGGEEWRASVRTPGSLAWVPGPFTEPGIQEMRGSMGAEKH